MGGTLLHSKTILVVERSCGFRREICDALAACDYTVIQAGWARDAAAHAEKQCIDIALIGLDLPDLNGIELAEILKDCLGPGLPVLFISAPDVPEMALLHKSADPIDVLKVLRAYFRNDAM